MIQLILPHIIRKISTFIIIILQMIFLFEYIWYFLKIKLNDGIDKDIITLFIYYNHDQVNSKTIEISILLIMYCFYIQKVNYSTSIYNNQKLDFEEFLAKKFKQIKILIFLQEIYVWILFIFIFVLITCYNIQLTFALKLFFFIILFYKFLNLTNLNAINKYIWILILFCGLNTLVIYLYQFKKLKLIEINIIKKLEDILPDFIKLNLQVIGFELYDIDLQ